MRLKLILSFVTIFLALLTVGYFGQSTIDTLIEGIRKESKPNQWLELLQELQANLVEIENSVRTYTITRDPDDLTTYYRTISSIDSKMNRLHSLPANAQQAAGVEEIGALIDEKLDVLNRIVGMSNDDRVEEVLHRVQQELKAYEQRDNETFSQGTAIQPAQKAGKMQSLVHEDTVKERAEQQRYGFFQKLFGSKKKNAAQRMENRPGDDRYRSDTTEISTNDTLAAIHRTRHNSKTIPDSTTVSGDEQDSSSLDPAVESILERIETEEEQIQQVRATAELRLIQQDKTISDRIRRNILHMENLEEQRSVDRAEKAGTNAERTRQIVLYTMVTALAILVLLLIIIFNDIARNNQQKKALRQAKHETDRLARSKQEFLSNVSHEIRTPLHAVMGFAEQLKATGLGAIQEEHLQKILNSSEHLMMLINDILDLSKIEAGKLTLNKQSFRPAEEIDDVANLMYPVADTKGLQLFQHTDQIRNTVLLGDPFRYRQILINLLSNAVKFSQDKGHIHIAGTAQQDEDVVVLATSVTDNGIGIPEDKLTTIFEYFHQADSGQARQFGGTGLGLSIVKNLVELHNGVIDVRSHPGEGSVFTVKIPYPKGDGHAIPDQSMQEVQTVTQNTATHVLAVDDQPYNLELLTAMLRQAGSKVSTATSGPEALDQLTGHDFDLVLLDIQMPGMNGMEVIDIYRKEHPESAVPFVAVTADAEPAMAKQLKDGGFSTVITKPFTKRALYQALEPILPPGMDPTEGPEKTGNEDRATPYELQDLIDLSEGNTDFVIKMLELFVKNTDETLEQLKQEIDRDRLDAAAALAHKAVPPCRHLNITGMVEKLKLIETTCRQQLGGIPGLNYQALQYEWKHVRESLIEDILDLKRSRKKNQNAPTG